MDFQNREAAERLCEAGLLVLSEDVQPQFTAEAMEERRRELMSLYEKHKAIQLGMHAEVRPLEESMFVNTEKPSPATKKQTSSKKTPVVASSKNITPDSIASFFNTHLKQLSRVTGSDNVGDLATLSKALEHHLAQKPKPNKDGVVKVSHAVWS